jgi:hypothetical protein
MRMGGSMLFESTIESIVIIAGGHSRKIPDLTNDLGVPKLFEENTIMSNQTKGAYTELTGIGP